MDVLKRIARRILREELQELEADAYMDEQTIYWYEHEVERLEAEVHKKNIIIGSYKKSKRKQK